MITKSLVALYENREEHSLTLKKTLIVVGLLVVASVAFVKADADKFIFTFSIATMFAGVYVLISTLRKIEIKETSNEERLILASQMGLICALSLVLTWVGCKAIDYAWSEPVVEIAPSPLPPMTNLSGAKVKEPKIDKSEDIANYVANTLKTVSTHVFNKNNSEEVKDSLYVNRFWQVAVKEKGLYKIPASIILAQGLLESDAGESILAKKAKNHFGIKTFSPNVPHINREDDIWWNKVTKKKVEQEFQPKGDGWIRLESMFRIYDSDWESFRHHSKLLVDFDNNYLAHVKDLKSDDFVGWAKALKKAGYCTSQTYDLKLITIIRKYKLWRYDDI
jgi:flagellum-specific peptidoglycan hydrolase FlgJ